MSAKTVVVLAIAGLVAIAAAVQANSAKTTPSESSIDSAPISVGNSEDLPPTSQTINYGWKPDEVCFKTTLDSRFWVGGKWTAWKHASSPIRQGCRTGWKAFNLHVPSESFEFWQAKFSDGFVKTYSIAKAKGASVPTVRSTPTATRTSDPESTVLAKLRDMTGLAWQSIDSNKAFPYGPPAGVLANFGGVGMHCMVLVFPTKALAIDGANFTSSVGTVHLGLIAGRPSVIVDDTPDGACYDTVNLAIDGSTD